MRYDTDDMRVRNELYHYFIRLINILYSICYAKDKYLVRYLTFLPGPSVV